jgi:hypothetical protein
MRTFRRVPKRLPSEPALIRECRGGYAIWTGRNWHGSVDKVYHGWAITTPMCPVEVLSTFEGAMAEAESRALRAEGK